MSEKTTTQSSVMSTISRSLKSGRDAYLIVLVFTIIAMMVVPLPTPIIDFLIAVNLGFVTTVLVVALYAPSALALSTFPTILLVSTLFRLALTISTTRLILSEAEAGAIIRTFGEFVVAGNVVVGLVIFLIITVVQFVVITKGAERIAEVSARFQLDALPGKQMSIDSELRNGDIDRAEATRRRDELSQESQFYGAMDGAMKFVKGDAIAGLIVVAVNLIGGLTIGMAQMGMSAGEAGQIYSLLTIGDGLVSQIPALIIAITAGMLVSKVVMPEARNFGADIAVQISGDQKLLAAAGVVMIFASFVPGFPTLIFLMIALALFSPLLLTLWQSRQDEQKEDVQIELQGPKLPANVNALVQVQLGKSLFNSPDAANYEKATRENLERELGVPVSSFGFSLNESLPEYGARITEDDAALFSVNLEDTQITNLPDGGSKFGRPLLRGLYQSESENGSETAWTSLQHLLGAVQKRNIFENFNLDTTSKILDQLAATQPQLVDACRNSIALPRITVLLRGLLQDGVPLRRLDRIISTMVETADNGDPNSVWIERLRSSASAQICKQHANENGTIEAITLSPRVESEIRTSLSESEGMNAIEIGLGTQEKIFEALQRQEDRISQPTPILICNSDVRAVLAHFVSQSNMDAVVMSHSDITRNYELSTVEVIN